MEPLWSPAGATTGNRWQNGQHPKRLKQAKAVAAGCDRVRRAAHGKEGVDGSSPSEGFVLLPAHRTFLCQSRRAFAPSTSTQRPPASTGRMQVQRSAAAALIDRPYGTF